MAKYAMVAVSKFRSFARIAMRHLVLNPSLPRSRRPVPPLIPFSARQVASWVIGLVPLFSVTLVHANDADAADVAVEPSPSEADSNAAEVVTHGESDEFPSVVPVQTVSGVDLRANGATQATEALQFRLGVRADSTCSVCNATGVRLGGLASDYTLILVDGVPMFGSLSGAYALLMQDTAALDRIDIRRGPDVVRWGGSAIAGTLDLRTRRSSEPYAELSVQTGSFGQRRLSGVASIGNERQSVVLTAAATAQHPVDADQNGVTEVASSNRMMASASPSWQLGAGHVVRLRLAVTQDERQGGRTQRGLLPSFDDESGRALLETILSRRLEAAASHQGPAGDFVTSRSTASFTTHVQDSDYGGELYYATQNQAFAESILRYRRGWLAFDAGLQWRLDHLRENVSDDVRNWHDTGIFWRGDLTLWQRWNFQPGVRLSVHNAFGVLPVGDFRAAFDAGAGMTVWAMTGNGYRAPVPFFEQFKGVRPEGYTLLSSPVDVERTFSAGGGIEWEPSTIGSLSFGAIHTRVAQPLQIETTEFFDAAGQGQGVGAVRLSQADSPLAVQSLEVQANLNPLWNLAFDLGAARYFADDRARVMLSVTPVWQVTWQATFLLPATRTRFSWLGEVWSPMDLTIFGDERYEVIDGAFDAWIQPDPQPGIAWDPAARKPNRSPWYWVTSVRIEQPLGSHLRLFAGVDNLLDYRQVVVDSPLYVAVEPQNNLFDVIGIWGPQRGRLIYGGLTLLW